MDDSSAPSQPSSSSSSPTNHHSDAKGALQKDTQSHALASSGDASVSPTQAAHSSPSLHPEGQHLLPVDTPSNALTDSSDRSTLLAQARAFLTSPQVRSSDYTAKRAFLVDKGLRNDEIDVLLREMPLQTPAIPPRTYPAPLPSALPGLLLGVARVASWVAGCSVALLLVYFRFIYPRIAQTFHARLSLRRHQTGLLHRLTASLEQLKETRAETAAVLPRPELFRDARYGQCQTLDDVLSASTDVSENKETSKDEASGRNVPPETLLRCAIADVVKTEQKPTSEAIFVHLEGKMPWLREEDGLSFQELLWKTLSTSSLFRQEEIDGISTWSYVEPVLPPFPPLLISLHKLKHAFPEHPAQVPMGGRFQHTLQAMSDLTGYMSAQAFSSVRSAFQGDSQAEEIKREIRSLKSLVLNRRV
ncbi:uncharacterized protein FIBRA_02715 [Fibroporia radiculosa]|uniref:Peroxisomal membrane protein PEX14 n=1 Tax=Fibroporia radiculosa TaxID=599839 RepID=J4I976_9APHY|nr:uncharacterized protein FIBRA_02715 [Fibroporia radiculosa]CCM00676.1 predicted protein [Fibroporia radiculosa]